MPTKVKGLTSIEIAVLVAIVLAIAIAVAWYLYSTFAAAASGQPHLRVITAVAYGNGTIRIELVNTGSAGAAITRAEVMGRVYTVRGGGVWIPPGDQLVVYVDTNLPFRGGQIVQGVLISHTGYTVAFSAKVPF